MTASAQVELPSDCPSCGLESGLIARYDADAPACRLGVPASARCKLCGVAFEGVLDADGARATLRTVAEGTTFATEDDVGRALDAWATREGFASRQALLDATFAIPSVTHLWGRIARGEHLEVLADPFARWGMRVTETVHPARDEHEEDDAWDDVDAHDEPAPSSGAPSSATPSSRAPSSRAPSSLRTSRPPGEPGPHAALYPILSVIAADGEIHPEERRFLDALIHRRGLPPLADDAIVVHPAAKVARRVPRAEREATLKIMCEIAAADGMIDESERRVILTYAAAWGVSDETVDFWMWGYENMNTSLVRQLWTRLRRFVLPTRWAETKNTSRPSDTSLDPLAPSAQEQR